MHLDNEPVDGSPFLLKVIQPKGGGHITTEHTYSQPLTTTEIDFIVEGSADMDDCLFRASVLDPKGRESYCHVSRDVDGKRHVKFQPHCHGQYKVRDYELTRSYRLFINNFKQFNSSLINQSIFNLLIHHFVCFFLILLLHD